MMQNGISKILISFNPEPEPMPEPPPEVNKSVFFLKILQPKLQ
jgi:hypothetical protein